jgi:hypothetical protein
MNYRLEAFKRKVDEMSKHFIQEEGLLPPDLEVIGALLFQKYQGENKKFKAMLENTSELIKRANEFLKQLENE